eukprot:10747594-Alexandrium_andersonii.AAC.1
MILAAESASRTTGTAGRLHLWHANGAMRLPAVSCGVLQLPSLLGGPESTETTPLLTGAVRLPPPWTSD